MAGVSIQAIKELRERTHAGMTDCKNALVEAEGDIDKAVEIILKRGLAKSAKRAGAVAAEGEVRASVAADARAVTIVEVNVQTDFAARNELFTEFVGQVMAVAEKAPAGADINEQELDGKNIADRAIEVGAKLGEKVAVRRWARLELPPGEPGFCHAYVHMGGKIGVALAVRTDTAEVADHPEVRKWADDTAMQAAAMSPLALRRQDVDDELVAKQREIFEAQLRDDPKPKPEKVWPRIIEGKLNKWFAEVVLLEQDSVVVSGKKVQALGQAAAQAAGGTVEITAFARYERGEGVVQKKKDLSEDVREMLD
jgi:elongation factor Ts